MTDPSYGGKLTHVANSQWTLDIHWTFDDWTIMPKNLGAVGIANYRLYSYLSQPPNELKSPDGEMILKPTLLPFFGQEAFVFIADGYNGWPVLPPNKSIDSIVQQHFIQVDLVVPNPSQGLPLDFSLEFDLKDPSLNANNLELCYRQTPTTPNDNSSTPVNIRNVAGKPNTVVSDPVSQSGYYALMMK